MKKFLFVLIYLGFLYSVFSQSNDEILDSNKMSPNVLNFSILGNSAFFSLNYERQFLISKSFFLYSQLGLGYNEEFSIPAPCLYGSCPPSLSKELFSIIYYNVTVNTNINKVFKYLEFGIGSSHALGLRHNTINHVLYTIIGLRIHLSKKGNVKISTFIPFHGYKDVYYLFIPAGVSVGFYL